MNVKEIAESRKEREAEAQKPSPGNTSWGAESEPREESPSSAAFYKPLTLRGLQSP